MPRTERKTPKPQFTFSDSESDSDYESEVLNTKNGKRQSIDLINKKQDKSLWNEHTPFLLLGLVELVNLAIVWYLSYKAIHAETGGKTAGHATANAINKWMNDHMDPFDQAVYLGMGMIVTVIAIYENVFTGMYYYYQRNAVRNQSRLGDRKLHMPLILGAKAVIAFLCMSVFIYEICSNDTSGQHVVQQVVTTVRNATGMNPSYQFKYGWLFLGVFNIILAVVAYFIHFVNEEERKDRKQTQVVQGKRVSAYIVDDDETDSEDDDDIEAGRKSRSRSSSRKSSSKKRSKSSGSSKKSKKSKKHSKREEEEVDNTIVYQGPGSTMYGYPQYQYVTAPQVQQQPQVYVRYV